MFRLFLALVIGFALGAAAGLFYAWVISPVEFTDISPAVLVPEQRDEYVILAALAYAADGNLQRAENRLTALGDADIARTVTALAQRAAAEGRTPETVSALSALASALGVGPGPAPTAVAVVPAATEPVLTPEAPTPTQDLPTPTGFVTSVVATPTATAVFEYELVDVEKLCDPELDGPAIQALVQNAEGQPVPGVEVLITWEDGQDHFFTGLKPELGPGLGDFAMALEISYSVSLAARSQPAEDLVVENCEVDGDTDYPGSWRVTFRRLP
jgi:hypothetical protein